MEAVTFDYGQRHSSEIEYARQIAAELGVKHTVLDMALLNQLAPNALTREEIPVEGGQEGELLPLCRGVICCSCLLPVFWPKGTDCATS